MQFEIWMTYYSDGLLTLLSFTMTPSYVLFVFIVGIISANGQLYDRLHADLLRELRPTIPVSVEGQAVNVSLGMTLIQINSVDTDTGDVELDMWLNIEWTDARLRWDPASYNDIQTINVPHAAIWSPDIVPYNGHAQRKLFNSMVIYEGTVFSSPKVTLTTRCNTIDYDNNATLWCQIKFGSWTYNGNTLNLKLRSEDIDLSNFKIDRWELLSSDVQRNEMLYMYLCCEELFVDIVYDIVLKDTRERNWWSLI